MHLCTQRESPAPLAELVAGFGARVPIVTAEGQREVGSAARAALLRGSVADVVTIEIESAELKSGAQLVPIYVGARLVRLEVVGPLAPKDPFANVGRRQSGSQWIRAAARRYARKAGRST